MWVAGIDEAGRGCICGALCVASVIGDERELAGFGAKDSKSLSEKQRESIYQKILDSQLEGKIGVYVAQIEACEIDRYGLSWAMRSGLQNVLAGIAEFVCSRFFIEQNAMLECITLDGNTTFGAQMPESLAGVRLQTLVKADVTMPAVSCASIVAKVYKDRQMRDIDRLYPQYALAKNKGYGTLEHKRAIAKHGYCPHHRRSFKIFLQESLF